VSEPLTPRSGCGGSDPATQQGGAKQQQQRRQGQQEQDQKQQQRQLKTGFLKARAAAAQGRQPARPAAAGRLSHATPDAAPDTGPHAARRLVRDVSPE
jgi:hypothetical protein